MAEGFHFATLWEGLADALGDETAMVHGPVRRSWRDYDQRSARFAAALTAMGLGLDSKFGICLYNCPEYYEAQFGGFKAGAVPINVNYRYVEDELVYLLDNADAEALVFHAQFADRLAAIADRLPKLKHYIVVDDGSGKQLPGAVEFEALLAASPPAARREPSTSEIYMLYTGGTTGMPKGVMYEHGVFCAYLMLGYRFRDLEPPQTVDEAVRLAVELRRTGAAPISLVCCPLMHGTGMWSGSILPLSMGGTVITLQATSFNPEAVLEAVERERATDMTIVGDVFARPLVRALDDAEARGQPYDISSLQVMVSSGVMWTEPVKEALLRYSDMIQVDGLGSTEGSMGLKISSRVARPSTARFELIDRVTLFNDDGVELKPGSPEIGMIATANIAALGYFKDPEKTARTFRTIAGVRYCFPGDYGKIEADGSVTLLGRGSNCINTGGEKVFPEEVEEAIKRHPTVEDCLVVGLPDELYGQRVVAVVALRDGAVETTESIVAATRPKLAGYKLPKLVVTVTEVPRAANGKADYQWARRTAEAAAAPR